MEKKKILIGVLIALVLSSGLLLYRGFKSQPLSIVQTTVSSNDVIIKSQVDAVKSKIIKAINKIDTGGPLDTLVQSQQFQELVLDAVVKTTIDTYGRGNPFVPPQPVVPSEPESPPQP